MVLSGMIYFLKDEFVFELKFLFCLLFVALLFQYQNDEFVCKCA